MTAPRLACEILPDERNGNRVLTAAQKYFAANRITINRLLTDNRSPAAHATGGCPGITSRSTG